jgi:hypothetical protein
MTPFKIFTTHLSFPEEGCPIPHVATKFNIVLDIPEPRELYVCSRGLSMNLYLYDC